LFDVTLTSDKLAKNVMLETIRKDSRFSDNNIDLLPGQTVHVTVQYNGSYNELLSDLNVVSLVDSY
jgi:hypothetical protein